MGNQMIFKRYEIKYMLNSEQLSLLKQEMEKYMIADEHGKSTICSLYFDTPQYLLIRTSMDHPMYKEKLRLRSYGVAGKETEVFVELKKKYDSVVYKRRVAMTEEAACQYLLEHKQILDTQITREIDYCMKIYRGLAPAMMLSYEREAYYAKDDHDFRVTFDQNILWRDYDLSLCKGIYGTPILQDNQVLMEVKTAGAIPMWMVRFLRDNNIYKTTFSKYATAYRTLYGMKKNLLGIQKEEKEIETIKLNGGLINYA